jgi:nucleoside 2-deoxyribosyltransferase
MKLYLAGPLFSSAERAFNSQLASLLKAGGHEVWLPQDHEPRDLTARNVFEKDVEGIDWASAVVANMDGPDPDSGTCWECGYAYQKKPVIVYRTDFRAGDQPAMGPYNLMLTQSADIQLDLKFRPIKEVAEELLKAVVSLSAKA